MQFAIRFHIRQKIFEKVGKILLRMYLTLFWNILKLLFEIIEQPQCTRKNTQEDVQHLWSLLYSKTYGIFLYNINYEILYVEMEPKSHG